VYHKSEVRGRRAEVSHQISTFAPYHPSTNNYGGVVDIESLSQNMLDIVQETMQPDHISLWLKQRNEKAAG